MEDNNHPQSQKTESTVKTKKNEKSNLTKYLLIGSVLLFTFLLGVNYQKAQANNRDERLNYRNQSNGFMPNQRGNFGYRGGMMDRQNGHMMGAANIIKTVSDSSITVTNTSTNQEKTYKITSDTKIYDGSGSIKASDLKSGQAVIIRVKTDDRETATQIRVMPIPPMVNSVDTDPDIQVN